MKNIITIIGILFSATLYPQANSWDIQIRNETNINSELDEFAPCFWDGKLIYVASQARSKKDDTRFYNLRMGAVDLKGNIFSSALLPEMINSVFHEGPSYFNRRNQTLYFSRTQQKKGIATKNIENQVPIKIYTSKFENNTWSEPEEIFFGENDYNYMHPTVSRDGSTMIFSSDADGESLDLFISKLENGLWLEPQSLDSLINTDRNECFPMIQDSFLIFATNGRLEGQGYDLYISKFDASFNFTVPKLLPIPINSNYDDFGLIIDENGKEGYFSTNRPQGMGGDDIYSFTSDRTLFELMIVHPEPIKPQPPTQKETKPIEKIDPEPFVEKDTIALTDIFIDTELGSITVFDNIYYDLNSSIIKKGAAEELDALVNLMLRRANLKVQLSAHTDSRGSEVLNQDLSDRRALAARQYLITQGVESNRISAIGFGESRIRNHCLEGVECTEDEHRFNRRTEVKILDN